MTTRIPKLVEGIFWEVQIGETFYASGSSFAPNERCTKIGDHDVASAGGGIIRFGDEMPVRYKRRPVSKGPTCIRRVPRGAIVMLHPDYPPRTDYELPPVGTRCAVLGTTSLTCLESGTTFITVPRTRVIVLPTVDGEYCPGCYSVGWVITTLPADALVPKGTLVVRPCDLCRRYATDDRLRAAATACECGVSCMLRWPWALNRWQPVPAQRYRGTIDVELALPPGMNLECARRELTAIATRLAREANGGSIAVDMSALPNWLGPCGGVPVASAPSPERTRVLVLDPPPATG